MNTIYQPTLDSAEATYQAVARLKKLNKLRQREIAQQLKISECEVVAARCGLKDDEFGHVVRLNADAQSRMSLFQNMPSVGKVMALTRNETVVHERKGTFGDVQVGPNMGLVLGADIDLRLFLSHWQHAYAVTDAGERTLHSLQFYDEYGMAIQKIYATAETDLVAFQSLIEQHKSYHQDAGVEVSTDQPVDSVLVEMSDDDVAQFQAAWLAIKDVHEFFPLLKKYNLPRQQAFSLAPNGYAQQVKPTVMAQVLTNAAEQQLPIMVFVGNRGAIQIHTGVVNNIKRMGDWFNVLDPDFNLHIKENEVTDAWVVRRPSDYGVITSLDFFDAHGVQVMTFFGQRHQGEAELPAWADLVAQLSEKALA